MNIRKSTSAGSVSLPLVFLISLMVSSWLLTLFVAVHMRRALVEEIQFIRLHYLAEGYVSLLLAGAEVANLLGTDEEWQEGEYEYMLARAAGDTWRLTVWDRAHAISVVYVLVMEVKDGKAKFVRLERG